MKGDLPRFGPYRGVRELARGGMGAVWEGVHEATGARAAVKTLLPGAGAEEALRLRREAELLGRLDHPHVVRVHAAELAGPTPWIALDLLPGGSLQQRLARGPLPVDEAVDLAHKLADALAQVHPRGALHRDLKPHNVMFDEQGQPRLVDFGLGLDDRGGARLTQTGVVLGTPAFMAPEQAMGLKEEDARTDVHGLGATLFAMLTARPPFEGPSGAAVLAAVVERAPVAPSRLRPDVPPWLDAVVLRALAKRPEERFQDAASLALALDDGARRRARPPLALVAGAAGAAALALGSVLLARPAGDPVQAADPAPATSRAVTQPVEPTGDAVTPPLDGAYEAALAEGDLAALRRLAPRGQPGEALQQRVARAWLAELRRLDPRIGLTTLYDASIGQESGERLLRGMAEALRLARQAWPEVPDAELLAAAPKWYEALSMSADEARTGASMAALLVGLERESQDPVARYARLRAELHGGAPVPDVRRAYELMSALERPPSEVVTARGKVFRYLRSRLRADQAQELLEAELAREAPAPLAVQDWVETTLWRAIPRGTSDEAEARFAEVERWLRGYIERMRSGGESMPTILETRLRQLERRRELLRLPDELLLEWRRTLSPSREDGERAAALIRAAGARPGAGPAAFAGALGGDPRARAQVDEVLRLLREAQRLDPRRVVSIQPELVGLFLGLMQQADEVDDSLPSLTELAAAVLEALPDDPAVVYVWVRTQPCRTDAAAALALRRLERARVLAAAVERPRGPEMRYVRGQIVHEMRNYARSAAQVERLHRLVELDAQEDDAAAQVLLLLAELRLGQGRHEEARAALARVGALLALEEELPVWGKYRVRYAKALDLLRSSPR